ncbi:MAG: sigma-70 family RNA polymerase sigma factor [Phycisphaerales bacterium]|nr:sigma-70 family RNA polymerase sigma factor [Phycisphaerales bacterium]
MTTQTKDTHSALSVLERTIVEGIHRHEQDALERLMKRCAGRCRRALRHRASDPDHLEQAIGDTALLAWARPDRIRPDRHGGLEGWYLAVCRVMLLRIESDTAERRRRLPVRADSECLVRCATCDETEANTGTHRARDAVRRAVLELSEMQRAIVEADLASPSLKADTRELAASLGSTPGSIRSLRSLAYSRLGVLLAEWHASIGGAP